MPSIAVLVVLETDDARLDPERVDVSTAAAAAATRRAVIENLPRLTRVVMVTTEEEARIICEALDFVMRWAGRDDLIAKPPKSYVPPDRG